MGKKIGEEITQKIKSAVKAKLIELGIEVDNELPDYIMVLVANKKTQAQMENDLQLFLGANTVIFTTWLVNVLKKLEEVTVSKKNYKRIEVTSQGGGVIVTKKEEDYDRRRALKLAARVKLEPGTSQSETESTLPAPETEASQEPSFEAEDEGRNEFEDAQDDELNSSEDEETETNSKNDVEEEDDDEATSAPEQTLETEAVSNDENSLDKPSGNIEESDTLPAEPDQGADSNDDGSEALETRERDEELSDSSHPKDINEQIDEVMEKTINGNKQPRRDSDKFLDDQDKEEFNEQRGSPNEHSRSYDNRRRSVENEFYRGAEKLRDDYHNSPDRFRNNSRRSPDRFRGTRRSPYNDRFRDKRSPYNDRYRDSGRRSYENDRPRDTWRRSPDNRRRNYMDDRRSRSPEFRRRSPIPRRRVTDYDRSQDLRRRSPINRQRSFEDKRVSPPINRRRSPIGRRKSPIDRRRPIIERKLYSDREEFDDARKQSQDRGRPKMLDAREILKRKNNQLKNVSPADVPSDEEMPKRRKGLVSMVQKPADTREREKSKEPQIPSLVKVTPRPVRNEAIQPNKKLLLLAVADAEKSVTRKSLSTRKRSLSRSDERRISERRTSDSSDSGYIPPEKLFITLTNNKNYSHKYEARSFVSREVSAKKLYEDTEINLEDELYQDHYFDYEQADVEADAPVDDEGEKEEEYVPQPVSGRFLQSLKAKLLSSENKCIISLESSPERSCDEWEEMINNAEPQVVNANPSDSTTVNTESKTEDGFEWNRLGPAPIATVKPLAQGSVVEEKYKGEAVHKALERCKYWPTCLSINCVYFHPTAPCQMFPACKSGKDCLFVHPDCKFGTACLNPKCIYLHREISEKKKGVEVIVSVPELPVGKPSPPLIKCVYFPNCKNLNCKFWHPVKNCKFGKACARSDCYFFHPSVIVPPKQLLTWTAKT